MSSSWPLNKFIQAEGAARLSSGVRALGNSAVSKSQKLHWRRILVSASLVAFVGAALLGAPFAANRLAAALAPHPNAAKSAPTSSLPSVGPFVGIDPTRLTDAQRTLIFQAATDFDRVRKGLKPTCKFESMGGFSDGGTVAYECPHYRLTVMKGLFSLQGIDGYLYGPIITFGTDNSVSDVRFYTYDELAKLLNEK